MRWCLLFLIAGCVVYDEYPVYTARIIEERTTYPSYTVTYKKESPSPPPQSQTTVVVIKEEPRLVRIEETRIYWTAYPSYDVYYVDGVWYCFYGGGWYWSYSWRGPWRRVYYLPDVFWYVPASHPRYNVIVRYLPPRRRERRLYSRYPTTRRDYTPPPRTIRVSPPSRSSHPGRTTPHRTFRSTTNTANRQTTRPAHPTTSPTQRRQRIEGGRRTPITRGSPPRRSGREKERGSEDSRGGRRREGGRSGERNRLTR